MEQSLQSRRIEDVSLRIKSAVLRLLERGVLAQSINRIILTAPDFQEIGAVGYLIRGEEPHRVHLILGDPDTYQSYVEYQGDAGVRRELIELARWTDGRQEVKP